MGLLVSIQLHSSDVSNQRLFYEQQLGLACAAAEDGSVRFETLGAVIALRPLATGAAPSMELLIRAIDLEAKVATLAGRGITSEGPLENHREGRTARYLDPEGNAIRLVQLADDPAAPKGVRVSHVFVNTVDLAACAQYYREVLGLKVASESEHWIEFATGETILALHASQDAEGLPLHPDQRISFALHRDDFDAWTEELRGRGVRFAAAPVEEALGVIAEVEDADGWCVVLHGPATAGEANVDQDYDEDDASQRGGARRGEGEAGTGPEFGSRKLAKKRRDKLMTRALHAFQRAEGGLAPRGALPREPREPREPRS